MICRQRLWHGLQSGAHGRRHGDGSLILLPILAPISLFTMLQFV